MLRSCGTCRQRRRACDRTKPTCQRCSNEGLKCQGYEQEKQKLFVNFTSGNITARRKRVLCEAIHAQHKGEHSSEDSRGNNSDTTSDHSTPISWPDQQLAVTLKPLYASRYGRPSLAELRSGSIHTLDLTPADFNQHVETIWNFFELGHTVTEEGWAPALTNLLHQDRSLDLALIALSALRLAQTRHDVQMRVMGLTAYQYSLRLHRQACERFYASSLDNATNNVTQTPLLATVSLMHALFEAVQLTPKTIFELGLIQGNPHLIGAGTFVKASAPSQFQRGGKHLMFKKLREMTLLTAFASYKPTFLASEDWSSIPWAGLSKPARDQLFDIAMQMASPVSVLLGLRVSGQSLDNVDAGKLAMQCKKIDLALARFRETWVSSLSTWDQHIFFQLEEARTSAIPPADEMHLETANVVLFGEEIMALRLVLALAKSELARFKPPDAGDRLEECLRTIALAAKIQRILTLPIFKLDLKEDAGGVVEGQCRSLIAGWALIEFQRLSANWD